MQKLFLCDQLLRDNVGHHLGYNLAITDAATRLGIQPILITHREFSHSVEVPVHGLFRTDYRANPPPWIATNYRLLRLLEIWCSKRFASDITRFPPHNNEDIIFAQMVGPRHYFRWIEWHQKQPTPSNLVFHLGYRPERFSQNAVKNILKNTPAQFKKKIYFVTDSEKLGPAFEAIFQTKIHYLPHIISYTIPLNERRSTKGMPLHVLAIGNARREKGFIEILQAVERVSSSPQAMNFNFTIQCHNPDNICREFLKTYKSSSDTIEWIRRPLSDKEYLQKFSETDIILLPYHLDCYAMRTSGIFAEARVAGIPVIVTKGSWAGDRAAAQGGAWLVPERNADALGLILIEAHQGFEKIKSQALAIAPTAQGEFHRDYFIHRLREVVEGSSIT